MEPVTVSVKLSDLENLLEAAEICAEDLSVELDQRYQFRSKYPTEQRRYERDMSEVSRLRACISMIRIAT